MFGGELGFGDAFWNFASLFGPPSDLGDNRSPQVSSLPIGVPLLLEVRHDPTTELMTLSVIDLSGRLPSVLETGLVPLDVAFVNGSATFRVDELTITTFEDLADSDPATVALIAEVLYEELFFERCCR